MQSPSTFHVLTINDRPRDCDKLFALWRQSYGFNQDIRFDFSNCRFLRPNAVAFLGGLARLIESRNGRVVFDWDTLTEDVRANLEQNGFIHYFSGEIEPWKGNSVPYRWDPWEDGSDFAEYLSNRWLGRNWVHVSDALRDEIADKVLELYLNAFEHARSDLGTFTCGQHFPKQRQLTLAVIDFGLGIAASVREYFQNHYPIRSLEKLTAPTCLKWAFTSGKTTKPNGTGRGLGLDLLKSFVQKNKGKLEVYSNDGYALIHSMGESYKQTSVSFEGTVAYITLNCDERLYCLSTE